MTLTKVIKFINAASGSDLEVGHKLKSCTEKVQSAQLFQLQGHPVTLIDTPGFDDSLKPQAEILKQISGFLEDT